MSDLNRTLKPPSTMIRLPKATSYTGQSKFRILNNFHHDNGHPSSSIVQPPTKATSNHHLVQPSTTITTTTTTTTRIPATTKPSGLVKPSATVSSTTSISAIKPSIMRPMTPSSRLARPSINSATVRKTKALPSNINNNNYNAIMNANQRSSVDIKSNNNHLDISILNNLTGDVSQIRRLLEQLLKVLENSHESNDNLTEENQRLKEENQNLKETISALQIQSPQATRTGHSNASAYYSPMN